LWPLAALPLPELELAQGLRQPEAVTKLSTCFGGGGESDARKAGLASEYRQSSEHHSSFAACNPVHSQQNQAAPKHRNSSKEFHTTLPSFLRSSAPNNYKEPSDRECTIIAPLVVSLLYGMPLAR